MQTSVKLYSLDYSEMRTYLWTALFVLGNVVLPQLCHLIPQGGLMLLPIYFFTLVAAYKYGWKVGLLTAVVSPLVNHVLFGMPPAAMLPAILVKSTLLAVIAAFVARRTGRVSVLLLLGVVLGYQLLGCRTSAWVCRAWCCKFSAATLSSSHWPPDRPPRPLNNLFVRFLAAQQFMQFILWMTLGRSTIHAI